MKLFPFLSLGDVGGDFVTDLAELSADKVYSLRSARAFLPYSNSESISNAICSSVQRFIIPV